MNGKTCNSDMDMCLENMTMLIQTNKGDMVFHLGKGSWNCFLIMQNMSAHGACALKKEMEKLTKFNIIKKGSGNEWKHH